MNAKTQDQLVRRLCDKIRNKTDEIVMLEEEELDTAEVVVISYGITSRVTRAAIDGARSKGLKVGSLRFLTVWPFPDRKINQLASKVKAFVVPEINYGQLSLEVERCAAGQAKTVLVPHMGGSVHEPHVIQEAIEEAVR